MCSTTLRSCSSSLAAVIVKQENPAVVRFSESTYLELADWTGRQVRKGKRGDHRLQHQQDVDGCERDMNDRIG